MNTRMIINTAVAITMISLFTSCSPTSSSDVGQTFQTTEQPSASSSIIGGISSASEYQKENGIVGLLMIYKDDQDNQMSSVCTGSLISSNVVLTAAHCIVAPRGAQLLAALVFFDKDLSVIMEEVGNNDLSHVRVIDHVKRHDRYLKDRNTNNDIGLVRFEGLAPEGFQTAELASEQLARTLRKGTSLTLAGFGVSEYKIDATTGKPSGSGDGLLRQIQGIKVVSLTATGQEITLDQSQGRGACHGDSGGPAYLANPITHKNILLGVTSRGTDSQGLCDRQAIYTGVMGYSEWIQDGLRELAAQ